jgi:hypothetical protein
MAIFGNSAIRRFLMCGHCQNENGWVVCFLAVAMTLLANLAVAYLINYSSGYEYGFNVWELWLFFRLGPDLAELSV